MAYNTPPTVNSGDLWTAANHNTYIRDNFEAGVPAIFSAKGDIAVADAADSAGRLAVGSNGQSLVADSTAALGVRWIDNDIGLTLVFGNGVNYLTVGVKGWIVAPYDFVIESVVLLGDAVGTVIIDIWKDTFANFPPVDADSITASLQPSLSAARSAVLTTLTGWTTQVAKGEILAFNIDTVSGLRLVSLALLGRKVAVS